MFRCIAASTSQDAGHPTARACARALAAALLAAACASEPAAEEPAPPPGPLAPGALRVALHFGADADLDLYVSDPAQETVYFANTPARSGGRLFADRRCDDAAPRVEVVEWPAPPPGGYRVGVDFPERCGDDVESVPFRLEVEGPGVTRSVEGEARFGRFGVQALQFEIPPSASGGAPLAAPLDGARCRRAPSSAPLPTPIHERPVAQARKAWRARCPQPIRRATRPTSACCSRAGLRRMPTRSASC